MSEKKNQGRGAPAPAQSPSSKPSLPRNNSFSSSSPSSPSDKGGLSLSHSLSQITSFMSTSFPSRNRSASNAAPPPVDVAELKEEFERKIAAVVFCLEEKAEENIDLSYKIKALQETGKQREQEKDRIIADLQKALKAKEEELAQVEKKANDEMTNELTRRIQTITHCLNDMAEENLRLRTAANASAAKGANSPKVGASRLLSPFTPPPPHSSSSFSMEQEPVQSSASILSSLSQSSIIMSASRASANTSPSVPAPSSPSPSPSPSSPSPSSSPAPTTNGAPPAANAKLAPAPSALPPSTATASTNTSPHIAPAVPPAPTVAPAPAAAPPAGVTPSDVAELKSEILAEEFLKDPDWVRRFSTTYFGTGVSSQNVALLSDIVKQDRVRAENGVKASLGEKIKELEVTLKEHDANITELTEKLAKEKDRTGSLSESVSEYEKKLKDLEGRMWDNLNKEAQRRTEAESKAKRLKKKVDELQFLLDELKDEGSDEDESDDEEEEKEKEKEKEKEEESKKEKSEDSSSTNNEGTTEKTET